MRNRVRQENTNAEPTLNQHRRVGASAVHTAVPLGATVPAHAKPPSRRSLTDVSVFPFVEAFVLIAHVEEYARRIDNFDFGGACHNTTQRQSAEKRMLHIQSVQQLVGSTSKFNISFGTNIQGTRYREVERKQIDENFQSSSLDLQKQYRESFRNRLASEAFLHYCFKTTVL